MAKYRFYCLITFSIAVLLGSCGSEDGIDGNGTPASGNPPYPQSMVIEDIQFDWSTHDRRAQGSDNWPVTWADDNHQYASWGDGGGFGGTNQDGRVSLGVARIEGNPQSYEGFNVWGGKDGENEATFGGKSYGILSVEGVLYMWVGPGSDSTNFDEARIYTSTARGASWLPSDWAFEKADGIILPTFLQFGRDYGGSRDNFVYIYANHLKDDSGLVIQKPREITLMRVPKSSITDRTEYEFFAGLGDSGNPLWTKNFQSRKPVFSNPEGVGWNTSVSYNASIDRYLLITEHNQSGKGNIGMFDAPEPWGPWTTVLYESSFGTPFVESTTFFWNFSNKWLSNDGREFVLILTGFAGNDSWNIVTGNFIL